MRTEQQHIHPWNHPTRSSAYSNWSCWIGKVQRLEKTKFLTSRIAQNPHAANSQPTSCDFASDIKLCYSAGAFDLAHSRSPWFSGFWPLNQTVFDASKDFCMQKQRMFQFSIFFTMLFVKVNRNLEWIAWQGRGSDGNPPYLPLSQLPRWMDWSDGWMNCMKCEIRFFCFGTFWTSIFSVGNDPWSRLTHKFFPNGWWKTTN